ncbi:MAG: GNAT family protein [Chloroflexota bacterium]
MAEGTKIKLRQWTMRDVDVFTYWQQPHHKWHQLDGPYYPKMTTEQVDNLAAKISEKIKIKEPIPNRYVIADQTTNEMVGIVTWYWESQETNWLSVGIVIFDEANWARGFGFEALGLWSQHLFDTMPELVRLDLRTWSGNMGMMKLAKKCGYKEEARFRMARIVNGKYFDGMGYGVLRSEWETLYPEGFGGYLIGA